MVSGGTDSVVSTALAIEQNAEVVAVHMLNFPFSDVDTTEKIKKILQILAKQFNKKIKLILVPYSKTQTQIAKHTKRKYACVLCRRMMLRVADKVAKQENAQAILTGESLGQVASQTLQNLQTEASAIGIPVLRPLLGMDKLEIERLARKFNTYETSILPGGICRLIPDKPATQAKKEIIESEESKLGVDSLVSELLRGINVYEIAVRI